MCEQSLVALSQSETYFRRLTEYALDLIIILEPGVFFLQKPYTIAGIAQKLSEVLAPAA